MTRPFPRTSANALSRRGLLKAALASVPLLLAPRLALAAKPGGKTLVLYFSHSGNTRRVAEMIHQRVGGDLAELKTVKPYPQEYNAVVDVAKAEQQADARPEIAAKLDNLADYGTVFIGYPNWWGTLPMPFFTLLEQHDMAGKTLIPFTTHEGSRFGRGVADLRRLCPKAKVLADGFECRGKRAHKAEKDVAAWLDRIAPGIASRQAGRTEENP